MLKKLIVLMCLLPLTAGCLATSRPSAATEVSSARLITTDRLPRVAWYYQPITSASDIAKLGKVDAVVTTSNPARDAQVIAAIHARHAEAFRYFQSFWGPAGISVDGLDMAQHMDWAFCVRGDTPALGKTEGGHNWYYFDANERAARAFVGQQLRKLKAEGYDGVFFDRGHAAFAGAAQTSHPNIWYRRSTCTQDPVNPNATFADAYAALLQEAHKAGLKLILNYGNSPLDPTVPLRPDPRSRACRAGHFATCPHSNDTAGDVDYYLDEIVSHPRDSRWASDFAANRATERSHLLKGRVIGLITDGQLGHDTSRKSVYFAFSRARLFNIPVAIFTGDDHCKGILRSDICNRAGIYPQLTNASFGEPVRQGPESTHCTPGSKIHCVWFRMYRHGFSLLNVSGRTKSIRLDLPGTTCQKVRNLWTGHLYASGRCVLKVKVKLRPWSGRPMMYSSTRG